MAHVSSGYRNEPEVRDVDSTLLSNVDRRRRHAGQAVILKTAVLLDTINIIMELMSTISR